ncbi:sigma-70 family RNA polymerase sigma factor [Patescibacteria group bacterium]|nr:MAG: sigma-70 family RNA polymerase sigma factor [Patescibacteria group bacterium]
MEVFCQIAEGDVSEDFCSREQGKPECQGCVAPTRRCTACKKSGHLVEPRLGLCAVCQRAKGNGTVEQRRSVEHLLEERTAALRKISSSRRFSAAAEPVVAPEPATIGSSVIEAIDGLSDRKREVLRLLLGLDGGGVRTLPETAEKLGVSPRAIYMAKYEAVSLLRGRVSEQELEAIRRSIPRGKRERRRAVPAPPPMSASPVQEPVPVSVPLADGVVAISQSSAMPAAAKATKATLSPAASKPERGPKAADAAAKPLREGRGTVSRLRANDLSAAVIKAIGRLPELQARIIRLRLGIGIARKRYLHEIAKELCVSERTVLHHQERATVALRQLLTDDAYARVFRILRSRPDRHEAGRRRSHGVATSARRADQNTRFFSDDDRQAMQKLLSLPDAGKGEVFTDQRSESFGSAAAISRLLQVDPRRLKSFLTVHKRRIRLRSARNAKGETILCWSFTDIQGILTSWIRAQLAKSS